MATLQSTQSYKSWRNYRNDDKSFTLTCAVQSRRVWSAPSFQYAVCCCDPDVTWLNGLSSQSQRLVYSVFTLSSTQHITTYLSEFVCVCVCMWVNAHILTIGQLVYFSDVGGRVHGWLQVAGVSPKCVWFIFIFFFAESVFDSSV